MNNSPSNIFLDIVFVREILPTLSDGFGCYMHEWVNPSNAKSTFTQSNKDANCFENHLNPVIFVFITDCSH